MPSANTTTQPAALPPGIEVLRAGRRIDDNGVAHEFTPADVAGMAAAYDPAIREAPLTVGHPVHDRPAYGWAANFVADGDRLLMTARDAEPKFVEMVRARRFPKRSLALYSPTHPSNPKPGRWYPRHVAFLGAQPPGIEGLKDIQFADTAEGLVCFSEAMPADQVGGDNTDPTTETEDDPMSKELQEQLAAEKARADKAAADLAAEKAARETAEGQLAAQATAARNARHADHVQFAEGALAKGKLKRPDVAALVAVLDSVAEAPVQFSEGTETKTVSAVALIKGLVDQAAPLVQFGEHAGGVLPNGATGGASGRTDAEIDADARAYAVKHNVQYAEALSRVVSFTTTG